MSTKKIQVGDISCGEDKLFLISGPCVIEEEMIMMKTAEKLKEVSERMNIKVIYKSSFTKGQPQQFEILPGPRSERRY
jgi:2-dehydro-3-deoxyphosphooctonate aldolase (KDO 8-P synthase)